MCLLGANVGLLLSKSIMLHVRPGTKNVPRCDRLVILARMCDFIEHAECVAPLLSNFEYFKHCDWLVPSSDHGPDPFGSKICGPKICERFRLFRNKPFQSPPLCVQDETKCDNIQYGKYQGIFITNSINRSHDSYHVTSYRYPDPILTVVFI